MAANDMQRSKTITIGLLLVLQVVNVLAVFLGTVILLVVSSFVFDKLGHSQVVAVVVGTIAGLCPVFVYSYLSIVNLWKLKQNIVIHFVSGFIYYVMFVVAVYVWFVVMKGQLYYDGEVPVFGYAGTVLSVGGILVNLGVYCWVSWRRWL